MTNLVIIGLQTGLARSKKPLLWQHNTKPILFTEQADLYATNVKPNNNCQVFELNFMYMPNTDI